MDFYDARNLATRNTGPGDDQGRLAARIEAARRIESTKARRLFSWVERLQSVPPFSGYKELLENSSSEPDVNGSLRQLLTDTVWPGTAQDGPYSVATVERSDKCQKISPDKKGAGVSSLSGMLVRAVDGSRAMFVSDEETERGPGRVFYSAAVADNGCTVDQSFYYVVKLAEPGVVIDAHLAYLAVVQRPDGGRAGQDSAGSKEAASLFALQWGLDPAHPNVKLRPMPPVIDTPGEMTAAEYIRNEVNNGGIESLKPVQTWRARAGSVVAVGGRHWRLFANAAVAEPTNDAPSQKKTDSWTELRVPVKNSGCSTRQNSLKGAPGVPMVFEFNSICFEVGLQKVLGPPDAMGEIQADSIWVLDAYTAFQAFLAANRGSRGPLRLASFPIGAFSNEKQRLLVGKSDTHWDGWVALEEPGKPLRVAPWATSALASLGCEVFSANKGDKTLCPPTASR
jgi:hypothetical protein